jgi:hypothetical protein
MRFRTLGLILVTTGFSYLPAQASLLPLGFVRLLEQSRQGAELLREVRMVSGRNLATAEELTRFLENSPRFRAFSEELSLKAAEYANFMTPNLGSGVTAFETMREAAIRRRIVTFYQDLSLSERAAVLRMIDSPFDAVGIHRLSEFLPRNGTLDFVGLGRRSVGISLPN